MAESLVTFLLNELSQVLKEEINLQRGVKREVELIKTELENISSFLRVADAKEEKDPQLAMWVKQVRDIAFDIEDILDAFSLQFIDRDGDQDQFPLFKCLRRITSSYKKWKINRQTGSELQSIKTRVKDISESHQRYYSGHDLLEGVSSSRLANMEAINQFRRNALLEDEIQLVGIEQPKQKLTDWLLQGDSHLKIVAVTGMGGLGKTTLVQQIYNNVKEQFESKALVTFSQSLKQEELLRELIRQLSPTLSQGIDAMDSHRLKQTMKGLLQNKRYLIVLDDVWKIEDWNQLKVAIPRNNYRSRVIITTRIADVAKYSTTEYQGMIHHLQSLSDNDSWTLFCKKAFQSRSCPPHLEQICRQIIKRCGGVPLAISTISGLLATKDVDRVEVWKMIQDSLSVELQENPQLQIMKRIFSLSFHDLPYYLKSCFLYLSIFPEDYLIERTRLVRLWIVEGFVEKKDGRTLEQVAESYFYELLNRSLIQTVATTYDGRVKSFRIHDFLRETILSKSKDENFVQVISKENATNLPEGARRLSILHLPHQVDMYRLKSSLLSKLRSLFLFQGGSNSTMLELLNGGFKLLKVLDLEGASIDTCPEKVSTLFLLRYLSLKNTEVSRLNIPIGNLHSLETLDLRQTYVTELPSEIYALHKLHHLLICQYEDLIQGSKFLDSDAIYSVKVKKIPGRFYPGLNYFGIKGFKASAKIGGLVSLEKLCYLDASEEEGDLIFELGRLVQLRRLCLINLRGQHGIAICSSISKMQYLSSLTLHASEKLDLQGMASPPPLLKRLYLSGHLVELPSWVSSLLYLEVLHLLNSGLKEDPFKSVHSFPSLIDLILYEAFIGEVMIIQPGSLARLKHLLISQYYSKTMLLIYPTAMPRLEFLRYAENTGTHVLPYHKINHSDGRKKLGFINDYNVTEWMSEEKWFHYIEEKFPRLFMPSA